MKYVLTFTCRACARTTKETLTTGNLWPTTCPSCRGELVLDETGRVVSTGHNPGGLH